MNNDSLIRAFDSFCNDARDHERAGRIDAAWACLESAHIIGQHSTRFHVVSHWKMLGLGLRTRDPREAIGQILRLLAALLITRLWVPVGNIGRARVSATASQSIPSDLQELLLEIGVRSRARSGGSQIGNSQQSRR